MAPTILPSVFGGLRLITLNESFNWLSEGTDPATTFGTYNVRTHNALCGFQFGSDAVYQQSNWQGMCRIKGGPFINFCDEFSVINAFGPLGSTGQGTLNRNLSNQITGLSFVGEITLSGASSSNRTSRFAPATTCCSSPAWPWPTNNSAS